MKVEQDAMAQHRYGKRDDVVVSDVVAAAGEGTGLCRQHNKLRGTNAAAVVDILLYEIGSVLVLISCRAHQADNILRHRFANRHHADKLLEVEQLLGSGDRIYLGHMGRRGKVHYLEFVAGAEVVEDGVEEEAVELLLGQRVSAFELNRILRCQHEKRRGQGINVAAHGAGAFLHGFEQCCLGLWRRAIDLVGQHDVAKDRALDEGPLTMSRGEVFFNNVRARNVRGHQVRRELDAPERQAQRLRNGAHHQRLGGAGQTGDQAMPTDEEGGKDLVQHLLRADNYLAHLGENAITDRINQ